MCLLRSLASAQGMVHLAVVSVVGRSHDVCCVMLFFVFGTRTGFDPRTSLEYGREGGGRRSVVLAWEYGYEHE